MKYYVFLALAALPFIGCSGEDSDDPQGSCTLSTDEVSYCEDDVAQSKCEDTDGSAQSGATVHTKFSESSCKDVGYTGLCFWLTPSNIDDYRCLPSDYGSCTTTTGAGDTICKIDVRSSCEAEDGSFSPSSCTELGFRLCDGSSDYFC